MGNSLAYLALIVWPMVCVLLFRKMEIERAIIWSILGGYLALPQSTEFNLPLVPDMDKLTIPAISAVLLVMFVKKQRINFLPENQLARWLLIGFVLCTVPSVLTNLDPIIFEVLGGSEPANARLGLRVLSTFVRADDARGRVQTDCFPAARALAGVVYGVWPAVRNRDGPRRAGAGPFENVHGGRLSLCRSGPVQKPCVICLCAGFDAHCVCHTAALAY